MVESPISVFVIIPNHRLEEPVVLALKLAREGKSFAIHCSTGIGLTGLYLTELAKMEVGFNGELMLSWKRLYVPGAVETEGHREMVVE